MLLLKKIISALLLPPLSPILIAALGLWLLPRRPRVGIVLAWLGLGLAYALSMPIVGQRLLATVDYWPPLDLREAKKAQAIVVLGGGTYNRAPEYGRDTVDATPLVRLRYAARVARETGLPVLTSGAGPKGGQSEADSMRDALARDFGVTARWVEGDSDDTRENAINSAAILQREGIRRVVLVTHAYHMRRAMEEFRRAGIDTIPAPTGFATAGPFGITSLLPRADGLEYSQYAMKELLGLVAQRLRFD